jgi:subtilase family serine protease
LPSTHDLFPYRIYPYPLAPFSAGGAQTIQLRAEIANSGSGVAATTPVVVRFFRGNPAAGGTQIGSDKVVRVPGCGSDVIVEVTWPNVPPGRHTVYVTVDPANALAESNETNNVAQATVLIATQRLFLPATAR